MVSIGILEESIMQIVDGKYCGVCKDQNTISVA